METDVLSGHTFCPISLYRRRTAAFAGPTAEDALRALGIDAAFIGANGILDGDISTSNMDEGRIQQLAFSKADARYLIADSSRIGRRYFCPPAGAGVPLYNDAQITLSNKDEAILRYD